MATWFNPFSQLLHRYSLALFQGSFPPGPPLRPPGASFLTHTRPSGASFLTPDLLAPPDFLLASPVLACSSRRPHLPYQTCFLLPVAGEALAWPSRRKTVYNEWNYGFITSSSATPRYQKPTTDPQLQEVRPYYW